MARMVRKQFYIEPRQDELLKRRARELGVTEAELVRQGIEHLVLEPQSPAEGSEVEQAIALLRERDRLAAWEELKADIEQRMNIGVPQTGRNWTRDELYEDRFGRRAR